MHFLIYAKCFQTGEEKYFAGAEAYGDRLVLLTEDDQSKASVINEKSKGIPGASMFRASDVEMLMQRTFTKAFRRFSIYKVECDIYGNRTGKPIVLARCY